jgi:hypothetical protein
MTNEITIFKELAVVTSNRAEWLDIVETVQGHIRRAEFVQTFTAMNTGVLRVYEFVATMLSPFVALYRQASTREAVFDQGFDELLAAYQQSYLVEASIPRHYADEAFEHFILIQQSKEFSTGYPLLKHAFDRLDYIVDKFITNDAWLVMSIETVMKRLARWLNEVAEIKKADIDDAWWMYRGLIKGIEPYLPLLGYVGKPDDGAGTGVEACAAVAAEAAAVLAVTV